MRKRFGLSVRTRFAAIPGCQRKEARQRHRQAFKTCVTRGERGPFDDLARELFEGIHALNPGPGDIPDVAGRKRKSVNPRRRGKLCVDDRHAPDRAEPPPFLGDGDVERQQPLRMIDDEPPQPVLQRGRLVGSSPTNGFNASPDLADHQDAEIKLVVGYARKPRTDTLIPTRPLAQLRQDIGIDEIAQSRTRRAFSLVLAKSRSLPTSGIPSSHCLKLVCRRAGRNADFRISRCSASMDLPLRAARVLSAATSAGSRLRTISCALPAMLAMISPPRRRSPWLRDPAVLGSGRETFRLRGKTPAGSRARSGAGTRARPYC
jgi:hypothetical protein